MRKFAKRLKVAELQQEMAALIAANGGELPTVPGLKYLKVNHGPGYNSYRPKQGVGEGIWVRPVKGDDEEGIGMLANQSLNYGNWGDFVQYSTNNPAHNPVILRVASSRAYTEVVQRNFDRVKDEN